jgi:hypothetical protein
MHSESKHTAPVLAGLNPDWLGLKKDSAAGWMRALVISDKILRFMFTKIMARVFLAARALPGFGIGNSMP